MEQIKDSQPQPQRQASNGAAPDPFDPERLRLSQDFSAGLGVQRMLNAVPVRKPSREWWIQTHPDPKYRLETAVLTLKEERETYVVDPELWPLLAAESTFAPMALFTAVNTQGVTFLWPIRLPGADGKIDDWNRTALEAATLAVGKWMRIQANMSVGAYDVWNAPGITTKPAWSEASFTDLLRVAFKDRHINSPDHPVLKRLRGEA